MFRRSGSKHVPTGTVGLPDERKFYCSELAAWSVGREVDREGLGAVLQPAAMSQFGSVLFDSQSLALIRRGQ